MARIAYIDHSFHQKTLSTDFLPDILRRHGHLVDYFWDESWNGGKAVAWKNVENHDVVMMFQSFCPIQNTYYRALHPNVIFIPMLDQFGIWQGPLFNLTAFWEPFHGSKVLNFSSALHAMTTGFGIKSHLIRYYQELSPIDKSEQEGLHGFFWIRREDQISWATIRGLISGTRFDTFHLHLASDPGSPSSVLPEPSEIYRHGITTSSWFERKADLTKILERANVFFAARMEEGIGQSFLEALSRGQCVVAPNQGTMNEYIIHGLNGLLYDAEKPRPIDFSGIRQLGRQGRESARIGRQIWEENESSLVDFILKPSAEVYKGKYTHTPREHAGPPKGCSCPPLVMRLKQQLKQSPTALAAYRKAKAVSAPARSLLSRLLK